MLFVAEYEFGWEHLATVVAKRLEWDTAQPENFRFVGEYIWQDRDPPFRGLAIIEAEAVEALNAFALHYGPTLRMAIHPATDVASGLRQVQAPPRPAPAARRSRRRLTRRGGRT